MKELKFYSFAGFLMACICFPVSAQKPDRVILFMIDGLHWKAPDTLNMPVLRSLIKVGTYIRKSYVIIPHHPTIGDYSKYNSCSFPNPILHTGTIFVRPENKMVQEVFSSGQQTAFVVNTSAYRSVARGFTTSIMDPSMSDEETCAQAISVLKVQDPVFMRIHLQSPGAMGTEVSLSTPEKSFYRNIWGKDSPYIQAIENADRLLGLFVDSMKETGKWEGTVLIVTSDHGQGNVGWHPLFDEDSWATPLVFSGAGIAKGRQLPYFEHTDLIPTITWLLGAEKPNSDGGAGSAVEAIVENSDGKNYHPKMYIRKINQQIREYNILRARMLIESEHNKYFLNIIASLENQNLTKEPFYHQDRIMDWYEAGSAARMIEANEKILVQMRSELENITTR